MKEITLPKELLNLPQPWGMTHPDERRQLLGSLSYEFNSIKRALNVLERSLHALSQLTYNKSNCIPEEMYTYWDFSAQWLAERIPTLDELDLSKVEEFLICDERIDSPSPDLIFDVAEYWVWWVTWDIEDAVLYWVEDALMATREPILISRFLLIASRYWPKIEPRFAQSLLRRSAMIGWQKARPLFDSVDPSFEKQSRKCTDFVKFLCFLLKDTQHHVNVIVSLVTSRLRNNANEIAGCRKINTEYPSFQCQAFNIYLQSRNSQNSNKLSHHSIVQRSHPVFAAVFRR